MGRSTKAALVVVDVQTDFLPGGALPVEDGDRILPAVGALMASFRFDTVVATLDWHPPGHVSFASSHPGARPFESLESRGQRQTLWPDHCVQGTPGAELTPWLSWVRLDALIRKGTARDVEAVSGFGSTPDQEGRTRPTGLAGYLKDRGIEQVYLCGLARDICVRWTALDAVGAGFGTILVWDACRPVDPNSDEPVRRELQSHGVALGSAEDLL
ncbi:MAG: nicotinamidase [Thermodesulfobacteriota bacterium]